MANKTAEQIVTDAFKDKQLSMRRVLSPEQAEDVGKIAVAALREAGLLAAEPEWEYGYELIEPDDRNVFEREGDFISAAFAYRAAKKRIHEERHPDVPSLQYSIIRRRKAGPWLPVEGESNGA